MHLAAWPPLHTAAVETVYEPAPPFLGESRRFGRRLSMTNSNQGSPESAFPRHPGPSIKVWFVESLDNRVLTSARSREQLDADTSPLGREPVPARKEDREAHLGEGAFVEDRGTNEEGARGLAAAGAYRHDLSAVDEGEIVETLHERYFKRGVQFVGPPSLRFGAPQANVANAIVG